MKLAGFAFIWAYLYNRKHDISRSVGYVSKKVRRRTWTTHEGNIRR
jgi:hypothetical protein